jgi:hypothetical protein
MKFYSANHQSLKYMLVTYLSTIYLLTYLLVHLSMDYLLTKSPINQPPIMVVPPWHVAVAKFQELPTCPPIDRTWVLLSVMVVWNQEGVF